MSTFKERLIIEKNELDDKHGKLETFILGDAFKKISPIQQTLLKIQFHAMATYRQCLHERIEWLEEQPVA